MDVKGQVIEWSRKMGYNGNIPDTLENICSNSTSLLWQDIIRNVRPKQEVTNIRHTIILNRLKEKPLDRQDEYSFPIKEIDTYIEKQQLLQKKQLLQDKINEKRNRIKQLGIENKSKSMKKENLKAVIKEKKERLYLIGLKSEQLERQIIDSEEMLETIKSRTPIELDESPNKKDITDTLTKCTEKLETLIKKIPQKSTKSSNSDASSSMMMMSFMSSAKTPAATKLKSIENLLMFTERKNVSKLSSASSVMSSRSGDSKHSNNVVTRRLFQDFTKINEQDEYCPKTLATPTLRVPKRESLGLLNATCINDTSITSDLTQGSENSDICLLSPITRLASNKMINPSMSSFVSVKSTASQQGDSTSRYEKRMELEWRKIMENRDLIESARRLINENNRQAVWNLLQLGIGESLEGIKVECLEFGSCGAGKLKSISMNLDTDLAKLYLIHIENELEIKRQNKVIKALLQKITQLESVTFEKIRNKVSDESTLSEIRDRFDAKITDLGATAALAEMHKQIKLAQKVTDNTDLQVLLGKIKKIKIEIESKKQSIQMYLTLTKRLYRETTRARQDVMTDIRRLNPFFSDLTWLEPLIEQIWSNELRVFERYPLEFSRSCKRNPSTKYKDLCIKSFPLHGHLEEDVWYVLAEVLPNHFTAPEQLLQSITDKYRNLSRFDRIKEQYDMLQDLSDDVEQKCNMKKVQQDYSEEMETIMKRLNSVPISLEANIFSTNQVIKESIRMISENVLQHHISPNRLVDGSNYKFYYDKFINLYESLPNNSSNP